MRFILIILMFITFAEASYIRSIRLGSFPSEKTAKKSLEEVKNFMLQDSQMLLLQEKEKFELKYRTSGKYYVTLAEPFLDKATLQKVLDYLRQKYKKIYVTKLKKLPISYKTAIEPKVEKVTLVKEIEQKIETPAPVKHDKIKEVVTKEILVKVVEEKREIPTPLKSNNIEKKEKTVPKKKEITSVVVTPPKIIIRDSSENDKYYKIIIIALSLIVLGLLVFITRYRKEKESYINADIVYKEKLFQADMELEREEKLLSYVSHELRTPMTSILGLIHLVLETPLSKLQKDYILKVESSSQHLSNLVNDILDVSKIHAGELKLDKSEFSIDDILDYIYSVNYIQAKSNNVILRMNIANDVPSKIIGDSLRLGQILINLVGNAVKFTKDGEVTLEVNKTETYGETVRLSFTISDNGIGMSEDQKKDIFKSYFQADSTITKKYGGTGLGLSIAKQLVEMMEGDIKVSSTKNVGSTFVFTIPFPLKDTQNQRYYRLPSAKLLHKNILIVDSSKSNVSSLINSLDYFNYQTHFIPSFEEVVFEENIEIDIVIIHQYQLTPIAVKKLLEMKEKRNIKLVILSDLYTPVNSIEVQGLTIDSHISFPCTQQKVLHLIVDLYVAKNLDKRSKKIDIKSKLLRFKGKRVLVVEDNEVNHKVIDGLLAKTGIELTFVTNGTEALDIIYREAHFDLILMDINLPDMSGYEVTKEIRKTEKYDAIPILAITADVMNEAIEKAISSGMQGHISKPIIIDIFYKKVLDALSKHSAADIQRNLKHSVDSSTKEEFAELSIKIGLGRCDHDIDFYKSILKEFKIMYINTEDTLVKLCTQGNYKDARTLLTDIKDVALNIGAYNLCESAATMEYELEKGSRSDWKVFAKIYEESLYKLIKDINHYLSK